MKFKYLLFIILTFTLYCCTPEEYQDFLLNLTEENLPDDTYGYVDISKECNCLDQDYYWNCLDTYWLFEEDYNRIIEIINQSDYPCIYVWGVDVDGKNFEGFVLNYGLY